MAQLTKEQIAANIERTGLPNPDFKLPLWVWFFAFLTSALMMGSVFYFAMKAGDEKAAMQASSPHTTQAGNWMREVSALPESPERQVFISELGVAMADGIITDKENTDLAADYTALTGKSAKGLLD